MRDNSAVFRLIGACSLGLVTSWSTTAAFAACGTPAVGGGGSGPPSIFITDSSTTQVLEQIRKRTEAATQEPILVAASESTPAQTQSGSSAPAQSAGGAAKPASTSAAKKSTSTRSAAAADVSDDGRNLKDYGVSEFRTVEGGVARTRGAWAQGFLDYERHKNIAPGNEENPTRRSVTGGGMVGMDWTVARGAAHSDAVQLGVFTGYSGTHSKFSKTSFGVDEVSPDPDFPFDDTFYDRSNNEQDIDGPFIGAYLANVSGPWTTDLAFKVDFLDISQKSTLTQTCGNFDPGGNLSDIGYQRGTADATTYTIAANIAYRHMLSEKSWLAPTVGVRFTHTDFRNDRSTGFFTDHPDNGSIGSILDGTLGLDDGSALRLQGGLRYGETWTTPEGYIWTTVLGGFLYSDVLVDGFNGVAGQTGELVGPVDEGKLRVLGQLATNLDVGNGVSYQFVAEIRGGEDVIGVGGLFGARYEW